MTNEALRKLYLEALAEVGFNEAAVQRGLEMLASGRYVGFADVVSSLQTESFSVGVREHDVASVVQRMRAQEARVAIATNGARAAARVAVRQADEAADRDDRLRAAQRRAGNLQALLREMTTSELDGRTPLRPHIAEALREHAGFDGQVRGGGRPSWVGRAPGPVRVEEAQPVASPTREEPPAEAGGLLESFRALGLSEEAASRAVAGR